MKKHLILTLILIMGLCACGTKQQPAPTAAPTAEPTAVPTEAPAAVPDEKTEESVLPTEETAGGKTQTADKQALDVINALEAAGGERMMVSDAYIVLDTAGKSVWKVPLAGLEFEVPDFMQDAHGGIRAMQGHETIPGTGIVELDVIYLSMTEREYYDLAKKLADYADDTENIDETFGLSTRYLETAHEFGQRRYPLFTIIGIGDNRGVDEILAAERKYLEEYYTDAGIDPEAEPDNRIFTPIGSAEDYNFFYVQEPMEEERLARIAAYGEQYKAEYQSLFNAKNQIIPNFTFSRPIGIRDLVAEGTGLSFETLDIQGSTVKGEDIFKGHKATMLNIWATTSAACISELPELMRLNKEFEEKGGQIVGLVYDAVDDNLIGEAREIAADLNIDFLTLLPNEYLRDTFDAMSYPTTYFLNEKGEIMGEPLMGAGISAYRERMAEYLE